MRYGDRRCYCDYVQEEIPSQPLLLNRLERAGFEVSDRRVLTTKLLGVPMTIFLLVLREAIEAIEAEQTNLTTAHRVIGNVSHNDLVSRYRLALQQQFPGVQFPPASWEHSSPWAMGTAALSGCTVYDQTHVYSPASAPPAPLDQILASPLQNVRIYKKVIRVDDEAPVQRPMIDLFKPTFTALEMSYAVQQRGEAEVTRFNTLLGATLVPEPLPAEFGANCARRGTLLHEGNLGIEIRPEDSLVLLGGTLLVEGLKTSLNQACRWVDAHYSAMLRHLDSYISRGSP